MPPFDTLLVLDLDETLIFADEAPMPGAEFEVGPYKAVRRPGLAAFLTGCLDTFAVGIWTSSSPDYASAVVRHLVPRDRLVFLWARDRCTRRFDPETHEHSHLKDIKKLRQFGFARERIVFVDDTPAKIARSYGNLVRVRPFEGDMTDRELPLLLGYLRTLAAVPDVRRVDKRGWWNREPPSPD